MAGPEPIEADVIVVGSGIAGAMTAFALAGKGVKVVVLEAGPRVERTELLARFARVRELELSGIYPNTDLAPRPVPSAEKDPVLANVGGDVLRPEYLRLVGGTTWIWAGAAMRLPPADFRMRSTYGVGTDWPISYDDLKPFYLAAEQEMGVAGETGGGNLRSAAYQMPPLPPTYLDRVVTERLAQTGVEFETMPMARNSVPFDGRPVCQGSNSCSALCPNGAQYAAVVHIGKAEALGARVIDNALVTSIETGRGARIESLSVRYPDGSVRKAVARAYVLAANAIETPRLMLASRSESEPDGIGNRRDLVGRNLADHHGFAVDLLMPDPVYPGRGPEVSRGYFGEYDGPHRHDRAGYWIAAYNWLNLHNIANKLLVAGHKPPALDALIEDQARRIFKFEAHVETLPSPENRVTLDWSRRDSAGMPGIVVDYTMGDHARRGIDHARAGIDRFIASLDGEVYERTHVFSSSMTGGTLPMGSNPAASVVDPDCRVHGYENLFVAGSSVFPTLGVAPPALTIAALSLRLSTAVADRLGRLEQ